MDKKTSSINDAFSAHEREQILAKARDTTPTQRVHWVEESVRLFSRQIEEDRRREPKKYF